MDFTRLDRRFIFLLVAAALGIFLYLPFALPTTIDPEVRSFFDAVDELEAGDVVVISSDYGPSTEPEIRYMHENVLYHLFYKDCRVICVGFWPYGPDMTEKYVRRARDLVRRDWGKEKEAGVDYVELPYLSGDEIAILNVASSVPDALPETRDGRRSADLPIMEGITGFAPDPVTGERTIKLLVDMASGEPGVREWIRMAGKRYDMRIMAGVTSVMATDLYPFMQSGQVVGFLGGLPGAHQYETLLVGGGIRREPSEIDADMAIQSVIHFLIVGLIVLGNLGTWRNRRRRRTR